MVASKSGNLFSCNRHLLVLPILTGGLSSFFSCAQATSQLCPQLHLRCWSSQFRGQAVGHPLPPMTCPSSSGTRPPIDGMLETDLNRNNLALSDFDVTVQPGRNGFYYARLTGSDGSTAINQFGLGVTGIFPFCS